MRQAAVKPRTVPTKRTKKPEPMRGNGVRSARNRKER